MQSLWPQSGRGAVNNSGVGCGGIPRGSKGGNGSGNGEDGAAIAGAGMQATARAAAGRRRQRQSRRRDHRASAAVAVEGAKGKPLFLLSFAIIYSIFFLFLDCDFVNFFVRHT